MKEEKVNNKSVQKSAPRKRNLTQKQTNEQEFKKEDVVVSLPKFQPNNIRTVYDVVLVNLIMLTIIFLSAFVPFVNVGLPFLVFIYLQIGVFGFVYNKETGKEQCYEILFQNFKIYIKTFCVFVVKMFLIMFWSVFLIVPGIVCALNYSFTDLILFENKDLDAKSVLLLSKELAYGQRWNIFFWSLLSLASVCVAMTLAFLFVIFFDLFLFVPVWVYIFIVVLASILDFVFMVLPMMQYTIVDCYINSKKEKTQKEI